MRTFRQCDTLSPMSAKTTTKGVAICHYCKEPLRQFQGTYAAIDTNDPPVPTNPEVGWRICSPGCPERPEGTTVVTRGMS